MMTVVTLVCATICILALIECVCLFLGKFLRVWKYVIKACPEEELVDISSMDGEHETFLGLVNVKLKDYQQKKLLGWCCEVTVSIDMKNKTEEDISQQAMFLVKKLDAVLRRQSKSIPYPLVTGCLVGDNAYKVYWQVRTPEEVERLLNNLQTDAQMSFVLREDRFWVGYSKLLSMLHEED